MRNTLIAALLLLFLSNVGADQITKIAVVDYNRILSNYYGESQEVREIAQFEDEIRQQIIILDSEVKELENQLLEARQDGDQREILDLEAAIEDKKNFLVDYIRVKRAQLEEMKRRLESELSVVDEILVAIQYVAESNGFSMVLRKDDPTVLWYSFDIDITDDVLNHLARR